MNYRVLLFCLLLFACIGKNSVSSYTDDVTVHAQAAQTVQTPVMEQVAATNVLDIAVTPNITLFQPNVFLVRVNYGDGYPYQPVADALYRGPLHDHTMYISVDKNQIVNQFAEVKLSMVQSNPPHGMQEIDIAVFRLYK